MQNFFFTQLLKLDKSSITQVLSSSVASSAQHPALLLLSKDCSTMKSKLHCLIHCDITVGYDGCTVTSQFIMIVTL